MNKECISIVVPVYNVRNYLEKCVNSILNQTYKNIELILVDDGSSDGSEKICDEYAKKDKRVVVYHQKNSGVSASRNKGIELATGKYLSFIDADDYVSENYVNDLLKNIDSNIGIVISNAKDVINDKIIDYNSIKKDMFITAEQAKKELFIGKKFSMVCWGNLYQTILAKKVQFDKTMKIAEDFDFLYKYFDLIQNVKIIKECNYYYLIREGSAINSGFNENWIRQMNYFYSLIDSKKDFNIKKYKIIRFVKETVNCSIRNRINGNLKKELKNNIKSFSFLYLTSNKTTLKDKIKFLYFLIYRGDNVKKVLVKGFFENNFGDDLFLKVLIDRYPNTKFYISSTSNYDYFIKNYKNIYVYKKFNLLYIIKTILNKAMKFINSNKVYRIENFVRFDEIVTVTGSLFMEDSNLNLEEIRSNYEFNNVRYCILGCNFGPYITKDFYDIHHNEIFKNAYDVCFRDLYSYNLFKDLKNVRHAPDIVFNLDISNINITNNKNIVFSIMNCNKDDKFRIDEQVYITKCIELINMFKKMDYQIKLVSFSKKQGDEEVIERIEKIIGSESISKYYYRGNIDECLNFIADSEVIVGTRYHANILGLLFRKKIIPISYSKKTDDALFEVGYTGNIIQLFDLKNITFDENYRIYNNDIDLDKVINNASKQFEKLDEILKNK